MSNWQTFLRLLRPRKQALYRRWRLHQRPSYPIGPGNVESLHGNFESRHRQ